MASIGTLAIKLQAEANQYNAAMREAQNRTAQFGSSVLGTATRLAGAVGIFLSLAGAVQAVHEGLSRAVKAEQSRVGFEVMLGGAEQAKQLFADLKNLAPQTPFSRGELKDAARDLVAVGVAGSQIAPSLRIMSDIAAGGTITIAELTQVLGRADVQGQVTTRELRTLGRSGIDVFGELRRIFGVSGDELKKMTADGQVGADALMAAFAGLTAEGGRFYGMAQRQSQTVGAQFTRLKEQIGADLMAIGQTIIEKTHLADLVEGAVAVSKAFGELVLPVVRYLVALFKEYGVAMLYVVSVIAIVVAAMKAITLALKAVALAQVMVQALSGPEGWAQLLVGAGIAALAAVGVGMAFDEMGKSIEQAMQASKGASQAAAVTQTVQKTPREIREEATTGTYDKLKTKLEEQIKTYGFSERAIERWKLANASALPGQLRKIDALNQELDKLEAMTKIQQEVDQTNKQFAGPIDKFTARLGELEGLRKAGLGWKAYTLAVDEAYQALEKATAISAKGPEGLEKGSRQAVAALIRFERRSERGGDDPQKKTVEILKAAYDQQRKLLDAAEQQALTLRQIKEEGLANEVDLP
jgi:tape measure domain-containing protein